MRGARRKFALGTLRPLATRLVYDDEDQRLRRSSRRQSGHLQHASVRKLESPLVDLALFERLAHELAQLRAGRCRARKRLSLERRDAQQLPRTIVRELDVQVAPDQQHALVEAVEE